MYQFQWFIVSGRHRFTNVSNNSAVSVLIVETNDVSNDLIVNLNANEYLN
jgi:hypothetical protein